MLTWTTDKPTVPGWYWWRAAPNLEPRPVQVRKTEKGAFALLEFEVPSSWWHFVSESTGDWAGPLEPPKEE